jgi:hypothetical protein
MKYIQTKKHRLLRTPHINHFRTIVTVISGSGLPSTLVTTGTKQVQVVNAVPRLLKSAGNVCSTTTSCGAYGFHRVSTRPIVVWRQDRRVIKRDRLKPIVGLVISRVYVNRNRSSGDGASFEAWQSFLAKAVSQNKKDPKNKDQGRARDSRKVERPRKREGIRRFREPSVLVRDVFYLGYFWRRLRVKFLKRFYRDPPEKFRQA